MKDPRVVYFAGGDDACAMYRILIPHISTPNSVYIRAREFTIDQAKGADIAVVQRLSNRGNMMAIRQMKEMGLKLVYDMDDNLWDVPSTNPSYKIVRIDRVGYEACMRECDAVIASTSALKQAIRKNMMKSKRDPRLRIEVIHNAMDFRLLRPLHDIRMSVKAPLPPNKLFKVGWGGSGSHVGDVERVFQVLADFTKSNTGVQAEFVGMPMPKELEGHERAKTLPFVPVEEYLSRLASWRWDLILAPLADSTFNKSKSNIKILEAAALKTPILVSDVAPYRDFCKLNKRLDYLVCKGPRDWLVKMHDFMVNPALRRAYGELLYQVATDHFDIGNINGRRQAIFRSLMK